MRSAWQQGPEQLRPLLEEAGVTHDSIEEFLRRAGELVSHQPPETRSVDTARVEMEKVQPAPEPNLGSADIERRLMELIGPIGEQLFAEVQHLPIAEQRKILLERLQSLGVAEEVLKDFH